MSSPRRSGGAVLVLAALLAALQVAGASRPHPHQTPQPATYAEMYGNYTFNTSRDTFDLCRAQAGLRKGQEVSLEELLPVFGLPRDLTHRKVIRLAPFLEMVAASAPAATVVVAPMLHGDADLAGALSEGLPKLVHFTVRDKDALVPHQVVAIASWAVNNPGYSIMMWDDADISAFMTAYYPHLLDTFTGLGSQVERTDMWRYLVLCTFGGVYADSDVVCAKPIDLWDQRGAGLLVGIENVFTSLEAARKRTYTRMMQMVQWTMAAKRGHPVVCRMGEYVKQHVKEEAEGVFVDSDRDHSILERTGPGIWSSSVHNFLLEAGVAIEGTVAGALVRDVRVLPQTVLGCPSAVFNSDDHTPYVYHMFKGSWRQEKPGRLRLLAHRLAPRWFPLPPVDKHHHNEKGRGGGGAVAAAPAAEPQQQQAQLEQPSLALTVLPIFAVLLLVAAALGLVLHRSGGAGRSARRASGGGMAGAIVGSMSNLLAAAGGSSHGGGPRLPVSRSVGDLSEQLLPVTCLPPRPSGSSKDSSRASSPTARRDSGDASAVACATGSAAQQPGRHSHKRSWGNLTGLGPLQQL